MDTEVFGEREDIKNHIRHLDYGLVFGGDLGLDVCFGRIVLDVRYSFGLANIFKDGESLAALYEEDGLFFSDSGLASLFSKNESVKNRAFIVMIGVSF
jgi:hypothetical protein